MNTTAEKHLKKAADYLGRGDEFYRHAAAEIELARESGATWVQCGDALGRSESWCVKIVNWAKRPANDLSCSTPWENNEAVDLRKSKQVLSGSPAKIAKEIAAAVASSPEVAEAVAANPVASARVSVAKSKKTKEAEKEVRASEFEDESGAAGIAVIKVGAATSSARTAVRMAVLAYRDAVAANPDNAELKTLLDDEMFALKADTIILVDGVVEGGMDAAFAEILKGGEA